MTTLGTLGIRLTAETAAFIRGMKQATDIVKTNSDAIRAVTGTAAAGFAGLSGAIGLATAALGEQRMAEQRLAAVAGLGGVNVEVIKEYAAALQQVTAFGDEATISATAMLQSFALTEDQLLVLIPRMQNLAAFTGKDMNSAAMLMGKALTDSASALKRVGIVMDSTQAAAFDAADKMGRVAILAEVIDNNVGNAAQTMVQNAVGAFDQLGNAAGDVLEEFGKLVETPLTETFNTLTAVMTQITEMFESLSDEQKRTLGIIALVTAGILGLTAALGAVALALPAIASAAPIVVGAVGGIATAVSGLLPFFDALRSSWLKSLADMLKAAANWVSKIIRALEPIKGLLTAVVPGAAAGLGAAQIATTAAAGFSKGLVSLGDTIDSTVASVKGKFSDFQDGISDATEALREKLAKQAAEAAERVGAKAGLAKSSEEASDALKELPGATEKWESAITDVGGLDLGDVVATPQVEESAQEITTTMQNISEATSAAGQSLANSIGSLGDLISAAQQGFAAGGTAGAITAVFVQLATQTESFGKIVESLNRVVAAVIEAVNPLINSLVPLIKIVASALVPVVNMVGKIFQRLSSKGLRPLFTAIGLLFTSIVPIIRVLVAVISPVFAVLGEVFRGVAIVVGALAIAVGWVVNAIIDIVREIVLFLAGMADVFGAGGQLRDFAGELQRAKVDIKSLERGLEDTVNGTDSAADSLDDFSSNIEESGGAVEDTLDDMNDAGGKAADTFREASAALTNVPQGFKVAAARFAAISTLGAPGMAPAMAGVGAAGSRVTQIENLFLMAEDPQDFQRKLEDEAAWSNFASDGTPISTPPDPNKR